MGIAGVVGGVAGDMFAVVDGSRTAAVAEPEGELRTGGRLDELAPPLAATVNPSPDS